MSPRPHLVLCILLGILLSFHTRADPQTRVNLNTASSEKLAEALSGVGSRESAQHHPVSIGKRAFQIHRRARFGEWNQSTDCRKESKTNHP
jgi:hypothetical protein